MFGFYTVTIIITLLSSMIMMSIVISDDILEKTSRKAFFTIFLCIPVVSIFELIIVYFEVVNIGYSIVSNVIMALVFAVGGSIASVYALAIEPNLSNKIKKAIYIVISINFIVPIINIFGKFLYYYDENNIYIRGPLFPIYIAYLTINVVILLYTSNIVGKKYQSNSGYILILLGGYFIVAAIIHFTTDYDLLWVITIFTNVMLYVYYISLVNQRDTLTSLLNRRCYESRIQNINFDSVILFLDVNDFKNINDTYGHSYGDFCLNKVGYCINQVYGKYASCYRIGGDEFCIILFKNLNDVEKLKEEFVKMLSKIESEHIIPTVSIGYSRFFTGKSNIQEVIEKADAVMYEVKKLKSKNT